MVGAEAWQVEMRESPWVKRETETRPRTTWHSYAGCAPHESREFQQQELQQPALSE